jgi:hypothetical protein
MLLATDIERELDRLALEVVKQHPMTDQETEAEAIKVFLSIICKRDHLLRALLMPYLEVAEGVALSKLRDSGLSP